MRGAGKQTVSLQDMPVTDEHQPHFSGSIEWACRKRTEISDSRACLAYSVLKFCADKMYRFVHHY